MKRIGSQAGLAAFQGRTQKRTNAPLSFVFAVDPSLHKFPRPLPGLIAFAHSCRLPAPRLISLRFAPNTTAVRVWPFSRAQAVQWMFLCRRTRREDALIFSSDEFVWNFVVSHPVWDYNVNIYTPLQGDTQSLTNLSVLVPRFLSSFALCKWTQNWMKNRGRKSGVSIFNLFQTWGLPGLGRNKRRSHG